VARARADLRGQLGEAQDAADRLRDEAVILRGENEDLRGRLADAEDKLRGTAVTMLKAARRVQDLEAQVERGQATIANIMQYQEWNKNVR
jgi:chromosome segregation ATPase